jgi:hypothetical protein
MTLNVVLRAKGEPSVDRDGKPISCAAIAQRWLAAADLSLTGRDLAAKLLAKGGPLDLVMAENIDRIETNLQIAHAPKSAKRDFRTDYLLKLFRYDGKTRLFAEATLENQIDRERILADAGLARDFKAWLLDPAHFSELDRGTILIPEKFLAKAAIAPTPVGFAPSNLLPEFGLCKAREQCRVQRSRCRRRAEKAASDGAACRISARSAASSAGSTTSPAPAATRPAASAAFHFPGVDWMAAKPPTPPWCRRRRISSATSSAAATSWPRCGTAAAGLFQRFCQPPQLRGDTELAGTEYSDGWGAHCYQSMRASRDNDASFRAWTCAKGLPARPRTRRRASVCAS